MPNRADMHVHTLASDGFYGPEEVVFMASQKVSILAITDHDTVDGLKDGVEAGLKCDVTVIPGIELSCFWQGRECHLLGYFISQDSPELMKLLEIIVEARYERMEKMLFKLKAIGINMAWDDLPGQVDRQLWGRPHLAQALVEKGIVPTIKDAFNYYLGKGKEGYVERWKLSLEEAVTTVKKAGGIPVLAHPGLSGLLPFIDSFRSLGVEGVEAYHPCHSFLDVKKIALMASKEKLPLVGGSDFHGQGISDAPFPGFVSVKARNIDCLYSMLKREK